MNFLEYEKIRNDVTPIKGLKDEIKQALYGQESYEQGYQRLKAAEKSVAQYWSKVDTLDQNPTLRLRHKLSQKGIQVLLHKSSHSSSTA